MADAAIDPLQSLLSTYPSGVLLLRDSLAASGHFLLPWITAAAVKQGHKVCALLPHAPQDKHTLCLYCSWGRWWMGALCGYSFRGTGMRTASRVQPYCTRNKHPNG